MNIKLFEKLLTFDEGETIDLKSSFPHVKSELLKDIISFANGHSKNSKYINYGVKDREGTKELVGMEIFAEQLNINQLLFGNIESHLFQRVYKLNF